MRLLIILHIYNVTLVCVSGTHCMCEITDYITHIQCNTGVCFRCLPYWCDLLIILHMYNVKLVIVSGAHGIGG